MTDDTAAANVGHGETDSAAASALKLLTDAVLAVPEQAVKELLSLRVCVRCIFRIFGVHEPLYSSPLLSPSLVISILGITNNLEGDAMRCGFRSDEDICGLCLGLLQFMYYDQQDILVKWGNASDFASTIVGVVKQDRHVIDDFSLEICLPLFVVENEEAFWMLIKKRYNSEPWFQKIVRPEIIPIKDVLKLSLTNPLETLLCVKSGVSSLQIRLTYTHRCSAMVVNSIDRKNHCSKRRKADYNAGNNYRLPSGGTDGSSNEKYETKISSNNVDDCETDSHREKVIQSCHLEFLCYRIPIYIGGRYLKFSRNVSQTRWIIDDERMGDASVEEIIGGSMLPMCQGDIYKFHAAGREDIDVRMLGSGRPFLIEIQNARRVPSDSSIKEIEQKINSLETKLVMVKNLRVLGSEAWTLMREGEAEKQKQYAALVWISRSLKDDDLETVLSLKDLQILQRTPVRVLHRRSPLERERIIHWMKIERVSTSSQYFLLHLCTQAGTYIKEFVHGDLGRTNPNLGSILGCRAEILQLDVTDVKMDCFLADGI